MTPEEMVKKLRTYTSSTCAEAADLIESLSSDRAEMEKLALSFADQIGALAFEMPAPNAYTPRFVQIIVGFQSALHRGRAENG